MAGPVAFERRVYPVGAPMDLVAGASSPTDLTFTVGEVDDSVSTEGPGYVIFDLGLPTEDVTRWSSRSGNTFTVPDVQSRGCAGTTAQGHQPGSGNVVFAFVVIDFDEANYWVNQLAQIQAPGDQFIGADPTELDVVPVGAEGQRWVVADGLPAWADPELPAPGSDGDVLTQEAGLPTWQPPFTPLLDSNQSPAWAGGAGISANATTTPTAVNGTYATTTFVCPASGNVIVKATGLIATGSDGNFLIVSWHNRSGGALIGSAQRMCANDGAGIAYKRPQVCQLLTGLTPGTTYTLDLWQAMSGGAAGAFWEDCFVETWSA